jgi:serine/threonine-protein kinase HipA
VDVDMLLARCTYFALTAVEAQQVLTDVVKAVAGWKTVALSQAVGLKANALDDFAPAFDPP